MPMIQNHPVLSYDTIVLENIEEMQKRLVLMNLKLFNDPMMTLQ